MKKVLPFIICFLLLSMKFYALNIPFDKYGNVQLKDYENYADDQTVTVTLNVVTKAGVGSGYGIGTIKPINYTGTAKEPYDFIFQASSPDGVDNVYTFTIAQLKSYAMDGGSYWTDQYGQQGITMNVYNGATLSSIVIGAPPSVDLIPLWGGAGTSPTTNSWDKTTNTLTTITSYGGGVGAWFSNVVGSGKDLSPYNEVVVNFEPVDFDVILVIEYNDATKNSVKVPAGATSVTALLMGGKSDVKQIYIQTGVAGSVTLTSAYADMNAVSVSGVSLDKTTATMNIGDVAYLTATLSPDNATDQNVSWTSSDPSVVTVSNSGSFVTAGSSTITAVGKGTATITVTTEDGSLSATCTVTVNAPVTGVSLDNTTATMIVGDTKQLTATVQPTNANDQDVTWSSSNESVATVSSDGLITAVGKGTAKITVTTEDGSFTATCTVTVNIAVTSVSLDNTDIYIIVGNTEQLTATVLPDNASDKSVTWSSSDETVATVSSAGLVTAVAEGIATITVTTKDGSFTATCTIVVIPSSTGIQTLSGDTSAYMSDGQLYVQSPVLETIRIYSMNGVLLYDFQKPAGSADYSVNQSKGTVLIVKGSSGWTKKLIIR